MLRGSAAWGCEIAAIRRDVLAALAGAAVAAPYCVRQAAAQPAAAPSATGPAPGSAPGPAPGPAPVLLGALFPLSGSLAVLGDESFRGLELAAEARNAAGGLLGRPVRLRKADAADPAQAAAEARRLLAAGVAAVFGSYASPLVFAASQPTELAGLPYFELGAVADPVTERGFKYLFRSCPLGSALGAGTVDAVHDALAPLWGVAPATLKLATLNEDGLYGASVSAAQGNACKRRGLQIVEALAYPAATADLSSAVHRLRAAGADVVLHTAYQKDAVLFFRQMRQVGWAPRMVVGAGGGYSLTDTASAVGADLEGAMNVDVPQYAVAEAAAPGAREVGAAYERRYATRPRSGHSLAAYAGAEVFLDAMERAGSLDRDQVRRAVLATDVAGGAMANGWGMRFDDKGQNTRAHPALLQWQGGTLVTVGPEAAAVARLRPTLGS